MSVRIEPLTGPALQSALGDLARLRIEVFREWPYLYDGSYDYERDYIAGFAASPGALIVAAIDDDRIVGAATATHMGGHADDFARPLEVHGYDLSRICYFGESVLLPVYRGRGLGHAFFDRREAHARADGRFTHTTFCAVVRPDHHELKPAAYRPLDGFWRKRGYEPVPGLVGSFVWKDIGEASETAKPMQYWMKGL
ncbi:MAG: GNAT family N-acetyltransferase [Hyphomicrobiaceae bacterium]|nr:GNAT family N-acetyltransferase [Hyphomicrobiaceae bacterium]